MITELPYAEDMPYWKTSKSGVENWLDKTEALLTSVDGTVTTRLTGKAQGREAIMFGFEIGSDSFKLVWPVLPTKNGESGAAMRQAATMVYHDTKARTQRIKIFSPRVVFADYLLLDSGETLGGNDTDVPKALKLLTA